MSELDSAAALAAAQAAADQFDASARHLAERVAVAPDAMRMLEALSVVVQAAATADAGVRTMRMLGEALALSAFDAGAAASQVLEAIEAGARAAKESCLCSVCVRARQESEAQA